MAGLSTYLQEALLGWVRGAAMPAAPAAIYVGLFSADPTDAGSLANEVTATIRTAGRVAATFGAPATSAGASTIENNAVVSFGGAAGPATVTHFALFDAASGGNMLGSAAVGGGGAIAAGSTVRYAAGALTMSAS